MRRMAVHDPGNLYAVPYMWTTTGLGYNVDQVRARLGANPSDSWGLLFDAEFRGEAARVRNRDHRFAHGCVHSRDHLLGARSQPVRPSGCDRASEVLRNIRPFIRYIDPAQYITDLANGSACIALGWSGDVEQARSRAKDANTGANIAYLVPREGAAITVDMMAIPADAPHPRNALCG